MIELVPLDKPAVLTYLYCTYTFIDRHSWRLIMRMVNQVD
jgi:hypothetical protein